MRVRDTYLNALNSIIAEPSKRLPTAQMNKSILRWIRVCDTYLDALNSITQQIIMIQLFLIFFGKNLSLRDTYLDALNSIIAEP